MIEKKQNVLRSGFILVAVLPLALLCLFIVACGTDGGSDGDGNGGDSNNNETLKAISFQSIYLGEQATWQVDLIQGNCADPDQPPDPEPFDHHYADVTFINRVPVGVDPKTASSIEVTSYEIEYEYSFWQPTGKIPITGSQRVSPCGATVPTNDCPQVTVTVYFLTMEQKAERWLTTAGTAFYTFYGVTASGRGVSYETAMDFHAANYDYCGWGE